ncbi:dTDP-4-dehydrorhamnose 3,5-epimerase family protein [Pseudomonas saponiphila]|uniref:dTDP-4-dehydrorhamnose 3,5-epimerase family protein n=1 Tax=Pseudomonas saponiphila TaxID=556534 RepID=UPI000B808DF8|nr:dTDP-4-dehydrorhamnose 3,5-epimerase family protein [Pseudomonas saponiphila]
MAGICCELSRKRIVIKAVPLQILGIVLIAPKVFCMRRSFFYESYNQGKSEGAVGRKKQFAQHGFASNIKNILCGLSYQLQKSQNKSVSSVIDEIFNVAVGLREGKTTAGCRRRE